MTIVVTLAGVLLSGFLAGFTGEAKKAGEEFGKSAFRRLESIVKSIFAGTENPEKEDLDRLAEEAPKLAKEAQGDELLLYATHSENMLRVYLETNMPSERAALLAGKIRKVAVEQILSGR